MELFAKLESAVDAVLPEGYSFEQPLGISADWYNASKQFVADNYWIPCTLSVVYVSFVFGMQSYLKEKDLADKKAWVKAKRAAGENVKETDAPTWATREPAWVKVLLFTWNMILGVFSMIGLAFTIRAIRVSLSQYTLSQDLCNYAAETHNPWFLLFVLSKVPELIDTVFLVVRRRPVMFLHWYHHVATMLYCWDGWANDAMSGSWFAVLNLFVHSIMYTYYAITTYTRFPQWFRLLITTLQLTQMVLGTGFTIHNLLVCPMGYPRYLTLGLVMYVSYFVLFAQLFYDYYCKPSPKNRAPGPNPAKKGSQQEDTSSKSQSKKEQ